jgi:archaellum component FlaG (FlaF/FlaG flagellin family)
MTTHKLTNFKVLSTGADSGHHYVSSEIEYVGTTRKITVLFKNKSDEKLLMDKTEITVIGNLIDEGIQQSLMLLEAEIIN